MKYILKILDDRLPHLRVVGTTIYNRLSEMQFRGSSDYWEKRYRKGGNSGVGSKGKLRLFKATILNAFVAKHQIQTAIEFGCGDGRQLTLANYPNYYGYDVSETAILHCQEVFKHDETKSFRIYDSLTYESRSDQIDAELSVSLDVIYHLVEDEIYKNYMMHLFGASTCYVVIYSTNLELRKSAAHIKHRKFSEFIKEKFPHWRLKNKVKNPYGDELFQDRTLAPDFYFFKKHCNNDT